MNEISSAARLRERAQDGLLKLVIAASCLAACVGFLAMWFSWIRNLKIIGLAIGWFFGLQAAVMAFVAAAFLFGLIALVALGGLELALAFLAVRRSLRTPGCPAAPSPRPVCASRPAAMADVDRLFIR